MQPPDQPTTDSAPPAQADLTEIGCSSPTEDLPGRLSAWEAAVAAGAFDWLDGALEDFLQALTCQGRFGEAQQALDSAARRLCGLPAPLPAGQKVTLARLLYRQGELCYHTGDYHAGCRLIETALVELASLDQPADRAEALRLLAMLHGALGDYERKNQLLRQGLEIAQETSDPRLLYAFLNSLGNTAFQRHDLLLAGWYVEHALQAACSLNDAGKIAVSLNNLGSLAYELGEFERARPLLEDSLATCPAGAVLTLRAAILDSLGKTCAALGDFPAADENFHAALEILQQVEAAPLIIEILSSVANSWALQGHTTLALRLAEAAGGCPQATAKISKRLDELVKELERLSPAGPPAPAWQPGDLAGLSRAAWHLTSAPPRLQSEGLP